MKETVSVGLGTYLLGLIAFLLVVIMFMINKLITLLSANLERQGQASVSEALNYNNSSLKADCTEEELAAITAVLAKLMPDKKLSIVNLKLIQ